jgi:hypothetical protein
MTSVLGDDSMPTQSDFCSEEIRKLLISRAGTTPDAGMVAEATLNILRQMAAWLAPVIGGRGVDVILRRALQLTSRAFPCLVIAGDQGDSAVLLANLKANLAASATNDAMEAGHALLVSFTELLSTLVGESLTKRLLSPVLAFPAPISEQETEL